MKSRLDQFRAPRNALLAVVLWSAPALAPALAQVPPQAPLPTPLELRLADVGRFAVFVDMGSVQWTGRAARLRVLQVTEGGFKAGTEEFWGGWRHEVIDCDVRTIAHAGFSSIRAGGREGPVTGDLRPAAPLPAGSADEAVAKVVCDGWRPYAKIAVAAGVEEAVKLGRPLIETGVEP